MTEPDMSKVEDRIAKLLAKAEKTTPEEAEALTEHAERLMLKYGIEQAVINAKRAGKNHTSDEKMMRVIIPYTGVYRMAVLIAMANIVDAFSTVKTVHGPDEKIDYLWLVGYESDVQQMKVLITSLQLQLVSALSAWWRTFDSTGFTAMQKFKARRQFIMSFGQGAAYRIRTARQAIITETESGEPGTALVLRDRKKIVDDWAEAQFNLTAGKNVRMKGGSHAAREAGYQAGKSANTGEPTLKATKQLKG